MGASISFCRELFCPAPGSHFQSRVRRAAANLFPFADGLPFFCRLLCLVAHSSAYDNLCSDTLRHYILCGARLAVDWRYFGERLLRARFAGGISFGAAVRCCSMKRAH